MSSIKSPTSPLIKPLKMSMSITSDIFRCSSEYTLIRVAQKIATYAVIPIALIAAFEMVVKNLILINLMNGGITLINEIYETFFEKREVTSINTDSGTP